MKSNIQLPVFFVNLVLLAGMAAIWIMFAPSRIGGQVGYIIVNGISMEPVFKSNDLVMVRKSPPYQVGDIVTYHDAYMGAYVIHRIIEIVPSGYVMQGDNNSWIDGYHPTDEEIIGKLWLHVPGVGRAFQSMRNPLNMAIVLTLFGGAFMAAIFNDPNPKKKNKHTATAGSSFLEIAFYTVAILAFLFLVLVLFAFSKPITRQADDIAYQHNGVFYYSAQGTPSVYDTDTVRAGEPIFPRLTCIVNLGFSYTLNSQAPINVRGSHTLIARISNEQSGWQRSIVLSQPTNFSGDSYSTRAELNLCQIQALVADVEEQTGFRPSNYTLSIMPRVSIMGQVDGQEVFDSFETALVFRFDKVHFYLVSSSAGANSPMVKSASGSVKNLKTQPNTFNLFGLELGVAESRGFGLAGLLLSLGTLGFIGAYLLTLAKRDQNAFIHIKHGALIINVYERGINTLNSVIEVTSIDDLAKLAQRQNTMILHTFRNAQHDYFVQSDGTTYRYRVNSNKNNLASPESRMLAPESENGASE